ncbi:MAG: transporter substrate-binding domain-containing protein [Chlorobiaceae bacterium]|nr:transporter substrate-binding domain-containing protein [Chlorobiaceae bacterium]
MTSRSPSHRHPARRILPRAALLLVVAAAILAIFRAAFNNRDLVVPVRDLDEISKSGKLRVLLAYDPINYFIYKGAPMGYSYELAERFARELGVRLEVVPVRDLNRQIPMLRNGEGDLIAHFMTVTATRSRVVDFSVPLDSTSQVLVQRKSGDSSGAGLVRSPRELAGKVVHVRENSAYYNSLREIMDRYGIRIGIVPVHGSLTTGDLIGQVDEGKIRYTVADSNIAAPHQSIYREIDISTKLSGRQPLGWAVRKNSPKLREALDAWLVREKRSGDIGSIHHKYYERQYQFRKYAANAFYSGKAGTISPFDKLVRAAAKTIGWDWRLLSSLIYEESQFDPGVVSWAGAVGLMQIMPSTGAMHGVYNLTEPSANIRAGAAYLESLEKEWKEIKDADTRIKFILASYNVGPGHVRDAQKLAVKYGANPNLWEDNVEKYLRLKSEPGFYNDDAADLGYCNGGIPVRYTRSILDRYRLYTQVIPG